MRVKEWDVIRDKTDDDMPSMITTVFIAIAKGKREANRIAKQWTAENPNNPARVVPSV